MLKKVFMYAGMVFVASLLFKNRKKIVSTVEGLTTGGGASEDIPEQPVKEKKKGGIMAKVFGDDAKGD